MAKLFMQENKNQNFLHGDMNNPDELLNQRRLYCIFFFGLPLLTGFRLQNLTCK